MALYCSYTWRYIKNTLIPGAENALSVNMCFQALMRRIPSLTSYDDLLVLSLSVLYSHQDCINVTPHEGHPDTKHSVVTRCRTASSLSDSSSVLRVDLCFLGAKHTLTDDRGVPVSRRSLSCTLSPSAPTKCRAGTHGGDDVAAAEPK